MIVDLNEVYEDEALRNLQSFAKADMEKVRIRQQRENEEQRKRNDEQASYVYWQQQVTAGKMLDTEKNREAVVAFLSERNLLPSVATVQAAIMALHETLDKPEVLETLPNGE